MRSKKSFCGAEEMASWFKALAALAEAQGSVSSTSVRWLTTLCNSKSRESDDLAWPRWAGVNS